MSSGSRSRTVFRGASRDFHPSPHSEVFVIVIILIPHYHHHNLSFQRLSRAWGRKIFCHNHHFCAYWSLSCFMLQSPSLFFIIIINIASPSSSYFSRNNIICATIFTCYSLLLSNWDSCILDFASLTIIIAGTLTVRMRMGPTLMDLRW